jgi:hypothetical protein
MHAFPDRVQGRFGLSSTGTSSQLDDNRTVISAARIVYRIGRHTNLQIADVGSTAYRMPYLRVKVCRIDVGEPTIEPHA